jgi:nucleoside triphosphate pyrophosphatase
MTVQTIDTDNPLILASASPRRKRLLEQIRLPIRCVAGHVDEHEPIASPSALCQRLALKKAAKVRAENGPAWVLGADTVVVVGNRVLGKPGDEREAAAMLRQLSGREHRVITGIAILYPSGPPAHTESVTTLVHVRVLSEMEIQSYVSTREPFGKAGGYAIQGIGAFMVETLSGSYTNVVGLPLCALVKALLQIGALRSFPLPINERTPAA